MSDLFAILGAGNTWSRILEGLGTTLLIALVSVLFSIILGMLLGNLMTLNNPVTKVLTKLYLEFFRLVPQLVLLFVFYYGITTALKPIIGIDLDALTSAIVVFTLWGTAEMGDLVRAALQSVPRGQIEGARSIGLGGFRLFIQIKLPIAVRQIIPQSVNLITRMIKTTSIVPLIGVMDVTKVGQAIIDFNRFTIPSAAFWIYALIFILYFICCWPLSQASKLLERKFSLTS
jgi:polar amino acid transport system permease protein